MSRNAEYWRKRSEAVEAQLHKKSEQYYKEAEKQFKIAEKKIAEDIEKWYARLAENNDISLAEARKFLNKDELEEFKWTVEEYIKHGEENGASKNWEKELENASAKYHIRRLEAIQMQIQQHIEVLHAGLAVGLEEHLSNIYKDAYYRKVYEIQKAFGIGTTFSTVDDRRIKAVLDTCWAADEKIFSDRIWQNKATLTNELNTILTQSVIRGENPGDYISALAKKMKTSRSNASRIIYTESAFIAAQADNDCYKDLGVEEFEFLATLDSHTSEICREMDGQHFPMSEYKIGVNAPPLHPWCRSTTCPYFNDEFTVGEERAARDENGDTYYVPADMTYKEWKDAFVNENDEARDRLGLITNNNKSNPKYYDYRGKGMVEVEREIGKFDHEVAVAFDGNGKPVFCQIQTGEEHEIKFTKYQLSKMKGLDLTHNHPYNTPPSPEDLYLLKNHGLKSIRACGKNGTYMIKYSEAIDKLPEYKIFNDEYTELYNNAFGSYYENVRKGKLSGQEAEKLMQEAIWEQLSDKYHIDLQWIGV